MTFDFKNLDVETRKHMLAEIDLDVNQGKLYPSKHFKDGVAGKYETLIRNRCLKHAWT